MTLFVTNSLKSDKYTIIFGYVHSGHQYYASNVILILLNTLNARYTRIGLGKQCSSYLAIHNLAYSLIFWLILIIGWLNATIITLFLTFIIFISSEISRKLLNI